MKTRTIILIGVLVREVFSFWTGHPFDFELWVRTGYWTIHGMSPYGVLPAVPGLSFASIYSPQGQSTIGYFPLWPLITGAMYFVYAVSGIHQPLLYYFLLKQPVIIGDILLAFAIYVYVRKLNPSAANWALMFWCFSPLAIILSGVWGMFDSLAMLFVLCAVISQGSTVRSLSGGIGTLVKSIPVIYSIPLALSGRAKVRSLAIVIATPLLLSLAILLALGWPIPLTIKTLESTVPKGGESLSLWDAVFFLKSIGALPSTYVPPAFVGYVWIPAVLLFTYVAYRRFDFGTNYGLVQSLLLVSLAFLIFRVQVNEQYSTYALSLGVIDVAVWSRKRRWLVLGILIVALTFLVINNTLLIPFTSPVYANAPVLEAQVIAMFNIQRFAAKFILSAVFTSLNITYIVAILRRKPGLGPSQPKG